MGQQESQPNSGVEGASRPTTSGSARTAAAGARAHAGAGGQPSPDSLTVMDSGGAGWGTGGPQDARVATPQKAVPGAKLPARTRWVLMAGVSALTLALLTVGAVLIFTRPASTIDQLLILTVPSGADVTFDTQHLGHSPVKLEGVRIGLHKILISKDGFQAIQEQRTINESGQLDFKLKPVPPRGTEGLSKDELIQEYQEKAQAAFERGEYAIPYNDRSALYFADLILSEDPQNQFGQNMREKVRQALLKSAQTALARGDIGQAQEILAAFDQNFQSDEAAHAAKLKLEAQIAIHRGDVHDLVRKAEEALKQGKLVDPPHASAYYYSKQALAIDRQNAQAKSVRGQVRDGLLGSIDQSIAQGDLDTAEIEAERAMALFPEDKDFRARMGRVEDEVAAEREQANDPKQRRIRGLESYRQDLFTEAVPDLEFAAEHGLGTPEVIFALGRSFLKMGDLDRASQYLRRVPPAADDSYRSAIAALGDVETARGNSQAAAAHYRRALGLGGSTLYPVALLSDKLEGIDKQNVKSTPEPLPLAIEVKHLHGGILHGTCSGTLTVNELGVRYDGGAHSFACNLMQAGVRISGDEMVVRFQDRTEKFKPVHSEAAERFRESLARFQNYESNAR